MSATETAFDFCTPARVVFGAGKRAEAGKLARSLGRRAFVVNGSSTLARNGGLDEILRALWAAEVDAVVITNCLREPEVADVDLLVTRLREAQAGPEDLVVGLGGGSAIDLAKAGAALVTQAADSSVLDYLEGVGRGLKLNATPLPVFAIPTTGGTGSEATKNAVISSYDPPFKKSLRSELMVPRIVLIDPELSVSVPPQITAWTGLDAITQLLESGISKRATPITQRLVSAGLELALPHLAEAYRNGSSIRARGAMAQAAFLSGLALANSGLGMAHGVAAALGVHCRVPHGLACAVLLPVALRVNRELPAVEAQLAKMSRDLHQAEAAALPSAESQAFTRASVREQADAIIEKIETLLTELQIPRTLSEIGVRAAQIPELVRDSRGNSMSGNPRELTDAELTSILEALL